MRTAILSLCLLVVVNGHGWLNEPTPRAYQGNSGNSASQTSPCGPGTSATYDTTTAVTFGGVLHASWTRGGGHGEGDASNACRFAIVPVATGDTSANSFNENVLEDNIDCKTRGAYQRDIPLGSLAAGDYYLQFRWKAGDGGTWYNCARVTIEDIGALNCSDGVKNPPETDVDCGSLCPGCLLGKSCLVNSDCESNLCVSQKCQAPVVPVLPGIVEDKLIVPSLIDYYSLVLESKNFVYVTATAPTTRTSTSWANYVLQSGTAPTEDDNFSSRNVTIKPTYSFTLCAEPEEATAYVGVRHSDDTAGEYTITLESYDAELVYEGTIDGELKFASSKYYNTPVYATFDNGRAAAVERVSGTGGLAIVNHRDTCGEERTATTYAEYACTDIKFDKEGTTWLNVMSDGPVKYKIIQIVGSCKDYEKTKGSATSTTISVILSLLAVVLALH